VAVVLAYDELPEGSDIRREMREGGVRIVIPAGRLPRAARRQAFATAAIPAGAISTPLLLLLIAFVYPFPRPAPLVMLLVVIIALAVFALIAWVLGTSRIHALQHARQQSAVLDADTNRLLIETAGPIDNLSESIPNSLIARIHVPRRRYRGVDMPTVCIELAGRKSFDLGLGRDQHELRLVVQALKSALAHT